MKEERKNSREEGVGVLVESLEEKKQKRPPTEEESPFITRIEAVTENKSMRNNNLFQIGKRINNEMITSDNEARRTDE